EAREGAGHRSTGDDDVLALELGAVVDLDELVLVQAAAADDRGDLAVLHQALEALPELVDHLLLAGLAGGEVDRRLVGLHAELFGAGDRAVDGGRLEELLGRDATPVEAGTADLLLLDHGDVEAGGSAVEGGGIAPGPSA